MEFLARTNNHQARFWIALLMVLTAIVVISGGVIYSNYHAAHVADNKLDHPAPVTPTTMKSASSSAPNPSNQIVDLGNGYTEDETNVYAYGQIITGADPKTFRLIAIA